MDIGKVNKLKVVRTTDAGLFLGDDSGKEALLPNSHSGSRYKVNDRVDAFIYSDGDGRLLASTRRPVAQVGDFACLRVNALTDIGAFMEWGLEKDLFVPFSEQKSEMISEGYYVVRIFLDEVSGRIIGSSRIDRFISSDNIQLENGQEVEVLVAEESQLGYSCIINGEYKGLIYHSDVYQDLFIGEEMIAYVKNIREDKLIDLSLQKIGFQKVLSATDVIMDYLRSHKGYVALHDKSSPEEIAEKFNMSKATFKKSIGVLYRHRKVLIKPDGVYLVEDQSTGDAPDLEAE